MTDNVIPANKINYTNVDEICGYQLLLCKMFEKAGGFELQFRTNCTVREVQTQGLVWLKIVRNLIEKILKASDSTGGLTLNAIPRLLGAYDFFHRVCNGVPEFDYIRKVRLKSADLWVKGNKSISQTNVVLGILHEADRDNRTLEDRYSLFAFSIMGEWIDELTGYGKFHDIGLYEAYDRLAYLLKNDLFVYLDSKEQAKIKAQWAKAYILADEQLDTLSTKDLWSYIGFAQTVSSCRRLPLKDVDAEYVQLFTKLASRPDLHPFYREAIDIDLAQLFLNFSK